MFIYVQVRGLHLILSKDHRPGIIVAVVIIISIDNAVVVVVHFGMQSLFPYGRSRAASIMHLAKVAV